MATISVGPHRLAFIHTVGSLVEAFKAALHDRMPEVDAFHILNESLLQDLLRHGPSDGITARIVRQTELAAAAGATLIAFTCSSTSPAIDEARKSVAVPIFKIDDAMAQRAVVLGHRICLVCTAASTVSPSTALIKAYAGAAGKAVFITSLLVQGAYDALMAGDRQQHDRLVLDTARAQAPSSDVIVLAQASLAHLQPLLAMRVDIPVLSSPPLLMNAISLHLSGPPH